MTCPFCGGAKITQASENYSLCACKAVMARVGRVDVWYKNIGEYLRDNSRNSMTYRIGDVWK